MRLIFKNDFDGRSWNHVEIIDQDTGEEVGYVRSHGVGSPGGGGIDVSLFADKYRAWLNRKDECCGFVKGVEAVLNHMTKTEYPAAARKNSDAA